MITFSLLVVVFFTLCSATVEDADSPSQAPKFPPKSGMVKFEDFRHKTFLQDCFKNDRNSRPWSEALEKYRGGKGNNPSILFSLCPNLFGRIMELVSPKDIVLVSKILWEASKERLVLEWELARRSFSSTWLPEIHTETHLFQRFATELEMIEYSSGIIPDATVETNDGPSYFRRLAQLRLCETLIVARENLLKLKSCNALKELPIELVAGAVIKMALGLHKGEKLPNNELEELLLHLAGLYESPQISAVVGSLNPDAPIGVIMSLHKNLEGEGDHGKASAKILLDDICDDIELKAAKKFYVEQCNTFRIDGAEAPIFDPKFVKRHGFSEELVNQIMANTQRDVQIVSLMRLLENVLSLYGVASTRLIEMIRASLDRGYELDLPKATLLHIIAPGSFNLPEGANADMKVSVGVLLDLFACQRFLPAGSTIIERGSSFLDKSVIPKAASLLLRKDLSRSEVLCHLFLICEERNSEMSENNVDLLELLDLKDRPLLLRYLVSKFGTKYLGECYKHRISMRDMVSALLEYVESDFGRVDELKAHPDLLAGMYLLIPNPNLARKIFEDLPENVSLSFRFVVGSDMVTGVFEQISRRIKFYMNLIDGSI